MKKTGEMLRQAREEKKLSLHEIGLSLKISSKILQAIETGDETQLPAKTFLRGFVKSYAAYLRMDVDAVMKSFQEEMGTTSPAPLLRPTKVDIPNAEDAVLDEDGNMIPSKPTAVSEAAKQASYDALHQTKNTKSIIVMIIAVILVALILCTKRMINKYTKEAELPQTEVTEAVPMASPSPTASVAEGTTPVGDGASAPTDHGTTTAPVEKMPTTEPTKAGPVAILPTSTPAMSNSSSTPIATPTPKPMASVAPSPVASATPATKVETPKASPTPVVANVAKATPTPSPAASASPSPSASPAAAASPTPSATPVVAKAEAVELIVEALDNVEIEYSAPKGKPQKIKLSAEQIHTFKSRSGLKINFSNGGAVNLILNGREIGIPGDLGQPIKLSY